MIHGLGGTLIGADLVEYNPAREVHNQTAAVAVKLLNELRGLLITDQAA